MKVTLELSETEVHALRPLAEDAGVEIETVLHHLIAQLLPPVASEKPEDPKEEDGDEAEERRREQAEMQANIRRWHAEKGAGEAERWEG